MSIPEASSSNNQSTETEPSSSSTTTDRNTNGLLPNTVKADIRPVFQRFGEVTRIFILPDGRRSDVVLRVPMALNENEQGVVWMRISRAEQARDDRAIFVSNFSPYDDAIGGTGTVREVRAIRDA
jgi:hypothetical protein